MLVGDLTATGA